MITKTSLNCDFKKIKSDQEWSFKTKSKAQTNNFSHGYHRYPAKFIPQIVDKLISDYTSPGDLIVDPFGGCGTTLVEAKLNSRRSIGFDINPVAKLITQTKISPIQPALLEKSYQQFLTAYHAAKVKQLNYHPRIHYWFEFETICKLNKIYNAIHAVSNDSCRRFYLCAFSHILKNSSRWLMKSIKPTIDKQKVINEPIVVFERHLQKMTDKNSSFYAKLEAADNLETYTKVYQRDVSKKWPLLENSIDLIITSPPYVTSYEYADLHQLSLLWFGSDPDQFKRWNNKLSYGWQKLKSEFIGTNSKTKKYGGFNSEIANEIVGQLDAINRSLAKGVANYFIDMRKTFEQMYSHLKTRRNSQYYYRQYYSQGYCNTKCRSS